MPLSRPEQDARTCAELAFLCGGFPGVTVLLVAVRLLLGLGVSRWDLPAAALLTAGLLWACCRTGDPKAARRLGAECAFFVLLTALALAVSGAVYDISWDGNAYHKISVGCLAYGWDPLRQTVFEFLQTGPFAGAAAVQAHPWSEYFPKGSWYFGAAAYRFTGQIECGKALNLLAMAAALFAAAAVAARLAGQAGRTLPRPLLLGLGVLAAANPISLCQCFSFYVDGCLGSLVTVTAAALFALNEPLPPARRRLWGLLLSSVIWLGCNLKFTSGALIGVFCAAVYAVQCVRLWRARRAAVGRLTLFYLVNVLLAFGVVGAASYGKNLVLHGHPFYPVMGAGMPDMMAGYLPPAVEALPAPAKWLLVFFSRTETGRADLPIRLKLPFTFHWQEFVVNIIDTERGGFGVFFSGLFLVSLGILWVRWLRPGRRVPDPAHDAARTVSLRAMTWTVLAGCAVLVCIVSASWLARYSPFLYLPVVMALWALAAVPPAADAAPVTAAASASSASAAAAPGRRAALRRGLVGVFAALLAVNSATFCLYPAFAVRGAFRLRPMLAETAQQKTEVQLQYQGAVFNLLDAGCDYVLLPADADTGGAGWSRNDFYCWRPCPGA